VNNPDNTGGDPYDTAAIAGMNNERVKIQTAFRQGFGAAFSDRDFSFVAVGK
jgi:hypothetical protein